MTVGDGDKVAAGRPLAIDPAFSMVLAAIAVFWLPASFNVADDVGAQMILAGLDGFSAAADVPFHSQLLNSLLHALYQLTPAVPWYGLAVLATTTVGVSLFMNLLLDRGQLLGRGQPRAVRWLCLPALVVLLGHCLYSITFTSAALLCQLGVFLSLLQLPDHQLKRRRCRLALLALLLLAFLWRWKLACYVLLLGVPIILVRPQQLRLMLTFAGVALALVACDRGLHRVVGAGLADSDFHQFYQLRAQFHDRPQGRGATDKAIAAAGWTRDDYRIYRELWVIHDDEKFNRDTVTSFLEANREARGSLPGSIVAGVQRSLRENAMSLRIVLPTLLGLLFWHWWSGSWRICRRPRWTILALLAASMPLLFLAYFRLVPRVAIPLQLYLVCLLAILPRLDVSATSAPSAGRWSRPGLAILILLMVLASGFAVRMLLLEVPQQRRGHRQLASVNQSLLKLASKYDRPILLRLNTGGGLRHGAMHPLRVPEFFRQLRIIPSGWQTGSPRYQRILKELGAGSGRELLQQAIDHEGIFFVEYIDDPGLAQQTLELWRSYYKRNLDREVTFEPVMGGGKQEGLAVYRLRGK